jgi:hypothetical protein
MSALKLAAEDVRELHTYGFKRASEILRKSSTERTDREARILNAISWAGRATFAEISNNGLTKRTNAGREIPFLLYAVSLESLIIKSNASEISYRFSTWGAHLIVAALHRSEIKNRLKKLYEVRSNIVHSGATSISSEDLIDMRDFAKSAVIRMLTDTLFIKMSKEKKENKSDHEREGFENWFEKQVLK